MQMKRIDRLLMQAKQVKNNKNMLNKIYFFDKIGEDLYKNIHNDKIYSQEELNNLRGIKFIDDVPKPSNEEV